VTPEDRGSRTPSDAAMFEAWRSAGWDLPGGSVFDGPAQRVRRPRNREDVDEVGDDEEPR
jgi:hypothetical protein